MRWVGLWLLLPWLLLPACNRTRDCGETCSSNEECLSTVCASWLVKPVCWCEGYPGCHRDSDCGAPAAICVQGICIRDNCHACSSDAQCGPGYTCQSTVGSCTTCVARAADLSTPPDLWSSADG